jgi:dihydroorotate dehydrogenase electron transfer subunit
MTEARTLAPFGRRLATVTAVEALGAYVLIRAADPEGPPDPRPGQFYMLAAADRWGAGADERPYLPRAFSFARVRDGELWFVLEQVGPGTARLAELRPGDGLWLTGPLGAGFTPPPRGRALLVGGGIGIAPLVAWQDELGPAPVVLLGFRSRAHAAAARLFAGEPLVTTDDGSLGRRALVTEPLRAELDRDADATVYACGPAPMLEAVRALCAERGIPSQLALESGMACGFGACFGCVVSTRDGYLRLCLDGPVLAGDRLEAVR